MIGLLDIGGTKIAAAAGAGGAVSRVVREPTSPSEPGDALMKLLDRVRDGEELAGIAVAAPGPFDRSSGTLVNPPGMPRAWWGLNVAGVLGDRYGCPVWVENDANCGALAEAVSGAGAGSRTVVYFTVSTGVGSGAVRDGRIVVGRHDVEGGHQVLWPEWLGGPACHCGGAGCLEALASGRAIEQRYGVRGEHLDDPAAWEEVGRWLGLGAANAAALIDPDVIVFGGGVCASWDRFAGSLIAVVRSHVLLQAPPPPIRRGRLPDAERNLVGAALLATAAQPA